MSERTTKVSVYNGTGKASGKPFKAIKLEIGKWSTLVFPTEFEWDYIEKTLGQEKAEIAEEDKIDLDEPAKPIDDKVFNP